VLWGSSFLVQTGGGHSDWIPRTTVGGIFDTVSSLTTNGAELGVVVFAAVVAGGLLLWRRDVVLGRIWVSCFAVTVTLAALAGLVAPVLLDRTLTVVSWGPLLAIGVFVDAALTRSRVLGAVAVVVLAGLTVPAAVGVVTDHSGPTTALRRLEVVARPGDVIAVRSAGKLPEIAWSLGVRGSQPWRQVAVAGLPRTGAIELGTGAASGRVWVLDWGSRLRNAAGLERCAPDWKFGVSRILCLQRGTGSGVHESLYAAAHERLSLLGRVTATR
jgi:hypothetical protein